MTTTQDVSVRALVDEQLGRWNEHDREGWAALHAPGVRVEAPGGVVWDGPRQLIDVWTEAFPDNRVEVDVSVVGGSECAQEARFVGTQTGTMRSPDGDVPPTGRSVEIPFTTWFRVEDGRITAMRVYFDRIVMMAQLGLVTA